MTEDRSPTIPDGAPPPPTLAVRNGAAIPLGTIPELSPEDFHRLLTEAPMRRRRIAALFGVPEPVVAADRPHRLFAVLAADADSRLHLATTRLLTPCFRSAAVQCPQVQLFEREIAEGLGLVPEGHPWLKPVRFPTATLEQPLANPGASPLAPSTVGITDFYRVEGEEVHEVAVGPVHAGVIEPGHFRFQCHGEVVFHLEISLGYQHRGIERALVGGPGPRGIHYAESLAGDTTVGHTLAYCQLLEGLAGCRPSARAHAIRAVGLELERLANHVGDLGALAGDVGYLPTSSFCGRLRGDLLNLTAALCGSRFGRTLVRPGGVRHDVEPALAQQLGDRLQDIMGHVHGAVGLLWEAGTVQARFEGTGTVAHDLAEDLGLVGVAARASGLERDVRHDHPTGLYRLTQIPLSILQTGDVFARAHLRWLEIQRSSRFVQEQLESLPAGPLLRPVEGLRPEHLAVSLVEGWRGEICHVALTDPSGHFQTYKIYDPSFHNWPGLALALRGEQISDFPLCNKSFNLSYCGHDL